ncbi:hypothetical protein GCM10010277_12370 [Streptomyces longisporoflavus]|nr:hypothetical protein GCM10010277_12370 [Streptomyces longisporoflavus]
MGGNASQQQTPTPEVALLITPLINAGMEDIARIAAEGANRPIEKWLPTVVAALGQAQMDFQGFLQLAAHATAAQTVKILDSIATAEEGDAVSEMYFQMCVLTKQPAEIPKLLVALRRHDGEASFRYAQTFIDAIVGKGGWPGRTRPDLADILRALRAASLKDDADSLAKGIGRYSRPKITLATAAAFPDSFLGDRELILFAVSQGGIDRLLQVIACLEKEEIPGVNSPEVLEFILPSVHESERADLSRALNDAGIRHVAKRLLDLSREVP